MMRRSLGLIMMELLKKSMKANNIMAFRNIKDLIEP